MDAASASDTGPAKRDATEPTSPVSLLRKPPLRGLVNKGQTNSTSQNVEGGVGKYDDPSVLTPYNTGNPGAFGGTVLNVTWAQLQDQEGAALVDGNVIDQGLALVQAFNDAHDAGNQIRVKLRVTAGFTAPDWAKSIAGSPFTISYTPNGSATMLSNTVGHWWAPAYVNAWRALQKMLAEKYDGNALIAEVAVASCATITDEPFVFAANPETKPVLADAGFTDSDQTTCLENAAADYSAWTLTPIDFTVNVANGADGEPKSYFDGVSLAVIQQCTVEKNCILSTHYLNSPLSPSPEAGAAFIYAQIGSQQEAGVAVADFQTDSPTPIDWCGTIANGVLYKALSIEVWPDFGQGAEGFRELPVSEVQALANAIYMGTGPSASVCDDAGAP